MIATVGEALVDLIQQPDGSFQACLGGSVCNFTLGLARQAVPATYLNPISIDEFGKQFFSLLSTGGVQLQNSTRSHLPTSLAIVSLDAAGSPSYMFYRDSVADRDQTTQDLLAAFPHDLTVLHTGGLALVPDDMPKIVATIDAAKQRGAIVSIDANLRPLVVKDLAAYTKGVDHALRQAHIIKVSDEDAAILGLQQINAQAVADHFFTEHSTIRLIAFTRGAHGAALITRTTTLELPAPPPLRIVDTVGAGDCFHAGLIASLYRADALRSLEALEQLEPALLEKSLRHAMASASFDIMYPGCNPGTWEQIEATFSSKTN